MPIPIVMILGKVAAASKAASGTGGSLMSKYGSGGPKIDPEEYQNAWERKKKKGRKRRKRRKRIRCPGTINAVRNAAT